MRTKLIAGNWKMNLTSVQGAALVEALLKLIEDRDDVDVAVCVPYLSIPRMRESLRISSLKLGAQDVFWKEEGAFTGQVSAKQLNEFCVDFCLVGHSETRGRFGVLEVPQSTTRYFGETDETVNLKIKQLLYYGISPILCCGETLAERESGRTDEVITGQIERALVGIDSAELYQFIIAYEPVWAIGTGKTCEAIEAERVCAKVREVILGRSEPEVADSVRVLYGGSVKATNAAELFAMPNIDGGLVGGASLDAAGFAKIVLSA